MRFLGGVGEDRAGIRCVSFLAASKAESLLEAFLSLFQSKFFDFYYIDIHGIGVFGCFG